MKIMNKYEHYFLHASNTSGKTYPGKSYLLYCQKFLTRLIAVFSKRFMFIEASYCFILLCCAHPALTP